MLDKPELLIPLLVFTVVMLFTPGPNNVMLMTSGLNFGFRRTLPHMLGVALGFSFLVLCVGLGLGAVFTRFPVIYVVLKYLGALYLLYLAWKIATSDPARPKATARQRPFSFIEAVAFQWVNPKGWVMAIGAITTYAAISPFPTNIILMVSLFAVTGIGSSFAWASLGSSLQHLLDRPKWVRNFNIVMAVLLVASLYPVFAD